MKLFMMPNSLKTVTRAIAHPDDDAMFFAPALEQLLAAGTRVRVLCLSAHLLPPGFVHYYLSIDLSENIVNGANKV